MNFIITKESQYYYEFLLIVLVSFNNNLVWSQCDRHESEGTQICLEESISRTKLRDGKTRFGAIDQFCIVTDISSSSLAGQQPTYVGVGDSQSNNYSGKALDFLVQNRAWPYQKFFEDHSGDDDEWENVDVSDKTPLPPPKGTKSPWIVDSSSIKFRGSIMKNWLQFRVHMKNNEFSKGRIKVLVLMVKDQDGWPIGDFTQQIPCHKFCENFGDPYSPDEQGKTGDIYVSGEHNALACAFTPPRATTHPGMYIFHTLDSSPEEGPSEVHLTWRFSQSSCSFVTEIHIQGLVVDDLSIRKPLNSSTIKENHVLGWAPIYKILYPTKKSLGSWDYADKNYLDTEMSRRSNVFYCHTPIQDSHGFIVGQPPVDYMDVGSNYKYMLSLSGVFKGDWRQYYGQHKLKQASICRHPFIRMGIPLNDQHKSKAELALEEFNNIPEVEDFLKANPGIKCPCPGVASSTADMPGSGSTSGKIRQHGRRLHASHMLVAWIFLVPLAIFVSRFYKENWTHLFCCQNYWWYMWHVLLLFVAVTFMMGAVFSTAFRKKGQHKMTPESSSTHHKVHVIMGSIVLAVFCLQLLLGFFRSASPSIRRWQICAHWAVGNVSHLIALGLIAAMGWMPGSSMSCQMVYILVAWFIFYVLMMLIMEYDLRYVDKKFLKLHPPRSFHPPPVKRLFTHDAPHRHCRCIMLGIFIGGLILFMSLMIYFIWNISDDDNSCGQSDRTKSVKHIDNEWW